MPDPVRAAPPGPRRTITVQGNGLVSAEPDQVVLRFDVTGFDPSYGAAVEELNRRVDALRRDLEDADIPRSALKTTRFNVRTKTKWVDAENGGISARTGRRRGRFGEEGEEIFLGYVAEHDLKLTLPLDQELLNRAFARVAASASEPKVSISFDVEDRAALRQQVLRLAVEDACRSARTMAEAARVDLGEIARIDYGVLEVHVTSELRMYEMEAAPSMPAPDITPSSLSAEDRVTVVWEIG